MTELNLTAITEWNNISITEIQKLPSEEILSRFELGMKSVSHRLIEVAFYYRELKRRGQDVSRFKGPLIEYLPLITEKKLLPSLLIKFAGQSTLLNCISKLDMETQLQIEKNDSIQLVKRNNDSFSTEAVRLIELHTKYFKQVFNNEKIRTVEQQIYFLKKQKDSNSRGQYLIKKQLKIDQNKLIIENFAVPMSIVLNFLHRNGYQINLIQVHPEFYSDFQRGIYQVVRMAVASNGMPVKYEKIEAEFKNSEFFNRAATTFFEIKKLKDTLHQLILEEKIFLNGDLYDCIR